MPAAGRSVPAAEDRVDVHLPHYYGWWGQPAPFPPTEQAVQPTDHQTKSTVVDRLRNNQYTKDDDVKIDAKQGVVVLGGEVSSWVAKRAAGDDAWDTRGVVDVSNQLRIRQTKAGQSDRTRRSGGTLMSPRSGHRRRNRRVRGRLVCLLLTAALSLTACGNTDPFDPAEWQAPGADTRIGDIKIRYGHVAEPTGQPHPVGADVPVYLWLYNDGDTADALVAASSPAAARVDPVGGDGVPGTLPWTLPARGELILQPGRAHLVLRQVNRTMRGGDFVPLELHFAEAGKIRLSVPVQPPAYDEPPATPTILEFPHRHRLVSHTLSNAAHHGTDEQ
jgi:copper(I)-binding protein